MGIGTSIFLLAAGAILRYAVDFQVTGLEIHTVGLILMIVGIIGLIVSVAYMIMATDRRGERPVPPSPPRDRDPYR